MGYLIAGGVITSPGASLISTGITYRLRYPSLALVFPLLDLLIIVAGIILILIGVVLLIRGYQLYKREKEWEREIGLK